MKITRRDYSDWRPLEITGEHVDYWRLLETTEDATGTIETTGDHYGRPHCTRDYGRPVKTSRDRRRLIVPMCWTTTHSALLSV